MTYNAGDKTCTGVCHSDGRAGNPKFLPVWGLPNSHGCGFCHAMPPASGAHLKHMPDNTMLHQSYSSAGVWSTTTLYAFGCANCHPKDAALHVNGSVDLSLDMTEGGALKANNRVSTGFNGYSQSTKVRVVCSATYCHGGYTFNYTYMVWDYGLDQPSYVTKPITNLTKKSPDWYGAYVGDRCAMCHGNPPIGGTWHSGYHGGQDPTGSNNQCQKCHSDATSPNNGFGAAVTNKKVHLNGEIDMAASFSSPCFGCH